MNVFFIGKFYGRMFLLDIQLSAEYSSNKDYNDVGIDVFLCKLSILISIENKIPSIIGKISAISFAICIIKKFQNVFLPFIYVIA